MDIATLADWAQVVAVPLVVVGVAVGVLTLFKVRTQITEMIWSQRAATGPLIKLSMSEGDRDDNILDFDGDLPVWFWPYRPGSDPNLYCIGKLGKAASGRALKCRVTNTQQQATGVADRIFI